LVSYNRSGNDNKLIWMPQHVTTSHFWGLCRSPQQWKVLTKSNEVFCQSLFSKPPDAVLAWKRPENR
jgi:hypothetical protein